MLKKIMHLIFLFLVFLLFLLVAGVEVFSEGVGVEIILDGKYYAVLHLCQTHDPHAVHPQFSCRELTYITYKIPFLNCRYIFGISRCFLL